MYAPRRRWWRGWVVLLLVVGALATWIAPRVYRQGWQSQVPTWALVRWWPIIEDDNAIFRVQLELSMNKLSPREVGVLVDRVSAYIAVPPPGANPNRQARATEILTRGLVLPFKGDASLIADRMVQAVPTQQLSAFRSMAQAGQIQNQALREALLARVSPSLPLPYYGDMVPGPDLSEPERLTPSLRLRGFGDAFSSSVEFDGMKMVPAKHDALAGIDWQSFAVSDLSGPEVDEIMRDFFLQSLERRASAGGFFEEEAAEFIISLDDRVLRTHLEAGGHVASETVALLLRSKEGAAWFAEQLDPRRDFEPLNDTLNTLTFALRSSGSHDRPPAFPPEVIDALHRLMVAGGDLDQRAASRNAAQTHPELVQIALENELHGAQGGVSERLVRSASAVLNERLQDESTTEDELCWLIISVLETCQCGNESTADAVAGIALDRGQPLPLRMIAVDAWTTACTPREEQLRLRQFGQPETPARSARHQPETLRFVPVFEDLLEATRQGDGHAHSSLLTRLAHPAAVVALARRATADSPDPWWITFLEMTHGPHWRSHLRISLELWPKQRPDLREQHPELTGLLDEMKAMATTLDEQRRAQFRAQDAPAGEPNQ